MELKEFPVECMEQFVQVCHAYPHPVDAGSLISKSHKAQLADIGLVAPKYGGDFRLTDSGRRMAARMGLLSWDVV